MRALLGLSVICAALIAAPAPADPPAARAAADPPAAPAVANTPAEETRSLLLAGQPRAAVLYGRSQLRPDSAQVELRTALGWAYVMRDLICMPLPVTADQFRMTEGPLRCDATFLAPGTRDTVATLFQTAAELSAGSVESHLSRLEFTYRFGARRDLDPAIAAAAARDSIATATRLAFLLRSTARPASGAAAARYLAVVYAESLSCADRDGLVTALLRDGDFTAAGPLARSRPARGACDSALVEPYLAALAGYGRYRELWDYTRASPAPEPDVYFRHALVAALAAAHFDLPAARARLAHEAQNQEAYPAPAREVLAALAALLAAEPAPADAWSALSGHPFCAAAGSETVRLLLWTHALRLDPKRIEAADALADELATQVWGVPAGECQERLAAALEAGDPVRERALRRSAQSYFGAEADRECRAVLARLAVREPADALLDGAAAFRLGARREALSALEQVHDVAGGPPALPWIAERLAAAAAELPAH